MKLPEDMDVPDMRRDTSCLANRLWLMRNLGVRNRQHPQFKDVMKKLSEINKGV